MVERYRCFGWDIRRGEMRSRAEGEWVLYSDYAALERQIVELRAEREENPRWKPKAEELAVKLVAAEAENARLRALPLKDEVERVLERAQQKMRTYVGVYPGDKELRGLLSDWDSLVVHLRAGEQEGWRAIEEVPDNKLGPFLVTNNPKALNAFSRPGHVWCVGSIHADDDGGFCAFNGYQKIHGLKLYMPVPLPASPSVSDGGSRNG